MIAGEWRLLDQGVEQTPRVVETSSDAWERGDLRASDKAVFRGEAIIALDAIDPFGPRSERLSRRRARPAAQHVDHVLAQPVRPCMDRLGGGRVAVQRVRVI